MCSPMGTMCAQEIHRYLTDADTLPGTDTHTHTRTHTHTGTHSAQPRPPVHSFPLLWRLHQSQACSCPARPETMELFLSGAGKAVRCTSLTPTSMLGAGRGLAPSPPAAALIAEASRALSQTLLFCSAHWPIS